MKSIGCLDCDIQCGIVERALCTLHPVNNAAAAWCRWPGAANCDSQIGGELFQLRHCTEIDDNTPNENASSAPPGADARRKLSSFAMP
jgi:hypothetical protein